MNVVAACTLFCQLASRKVEFSSASSDQQANIYKSHSGCVNNQIIYHTQMNWRAISGALLRLLRFLSHRYARLKSIFLMKISYHLVQ